MQLSAIHIDTHEVKALQLALHCRLLERNTTKSQGGASYPNIVRSYVTIISTHSSLIKGIIHVEGSGKPRHEWVPVLGDFLRKRVV